MMWILLNNKKNIRFCFSFGPSDYFKDSLGSAQVCLTSLQHLVNSVFMERDEPLVGNSIGINKNVVTLFSFFF